MPTRTSAPSRLRRALNTLLTQDCLLCGASSGAQVLCADCAGSLPALPPYLCPQCALPTLRGERCGRCLTRAPAFDATRAVLPYAFPVDALIQSFKYGHRLAPARYFGERLAERASGLCVDLVIPLPLHETRLRQRGFNQALELARPLAAHHRWTLDAHSCTRIRATAPQATLTADERAGNLRQAFHCARDLSGLHIALVDDVLTSGASLHECARTLKLHGAARVTALVVARALPADDGLSAASARSASADPA
ncbi:ComF family protein [Rhodocyclus tenuis]|uniref:ComF family protein n=1 Tax=Rhodocyclus gracilis TaxID=2929842 RepID=UPI00129895F4|nr:ComF family protein [Rhodocyclus gracilis]MRD72682.1 ComF family protein [Rhodocyclus gracilis]